MGFIRSLLQYCVNLREDRMLTVDESCCIEVCILLRLGSCKLQRVVPHFNICTVPAT